MREGMGCDADMRFIVLCVAHGMASELSALPRRRARAHSTMGWDVCVREGMGEWDGMRFMLPDSSVFGGLPILVVHWLPRLLRPEEAS